MKRRERSDGRAVGSLGRRARREIINMGAPQREKRRGYCPSPAPRSLECGESRKLTGVPSRSMRKDPRLQRSLTHDERPPIERFLTIQRVLFGKK